MVGRAGDFIFNEAEVHRLLAGRDGAVAKELLRRGLRVESRAKRNASGRPGPNVITGRLRASISTTLAEDEKGLFCAVGTNVEYAKHVEKLYPFLEPALEAAREGQ